jgi:spermidine synthase
MALDPDIGFDPAEAGRRFDAILLDVDHSPTRRLSGYRGGFYEPEGISRVSRHLKSGGVFALWSDDEPEDEFLRVMDQVFDEVRGEVVRFPNPLAERMETNGIYIGRIAPNDQSVSE